MELLVICTVALVTSGLTLFSGFGLGTLLLPAFLVFFRADLAVAMTAIVHLLNNVFKLLLVGLSMNPRVVIRFGLSAIVASFLGAALLIQVSDIPPLASYLFLGRTYFVTPVGALMGFIIIAFAIMEVLPPLKKLQFDQKYLPLGGSLSGFFGGLSGHQGALRAAFLIRAGLTKESFIATSVVIACLVDVTRISVYAQHLAVSGIREHVPMVVAATLSAFIGAFAGAKLVRRVTLDSIQIVVSILLFLVAVGIGTGVF